MLKLTNAKDKHDIAEQKERIKALKLENKKREYQEENIKFNINLPTIISGSEKLED